MEDVEGRIVDARAQVLRAPVSDGIAMSFSPLVERTMVLVEVFTADGRVGLGESWVNYPAWAWVERLATLREGVFGLVLGENADEIEDLHRRLVAVLEPIGRQWGAPGPVMQAISAVDVALWDLCGQREGRSISRLLGGRVRDEIDVYASSLGPRDTAEQARCCRRSGHRAVKVKVGFGAARDEANLTAAREALGDGTALFVDANQGWDVDTAVAMAPILRAHDVSWVEEPIAGNRLTDLEEFHRRTGIPVATGENLYGWDSFAPYAASPAVAILQPDVAKTGGLTHARAVGELAELHGKALMPHLYGGAVAYAATLQLVAAAPAAALLEYDVRDNPLRDPLLLDPPTPLAGRVAIPDGPGLGVRLDPAAVAAHTSTSTEPTQEVAR